MTGRGYRRPKCFTNYRCWPTVAEKEVAEIYKLTSHDDRVRGQARQAATVASRMSQGDLISVLAPRDNRSVGIQENETSSP